MRVFGFLWSLGYLALLLTPVAIGFSAGIGWGVVAAAYIFGFYALYTRVALRKSRLNAHWTATVHADGVELHHTPPTIPYRIDRADFALTLTDAIEKAQALYPGRPLIFKTATVHDIIRSLGFRPAGPSDTALTWYSAFWLTFWNLHNLPRLPRRFARLFRNQGIRYVMDGDAHARPEPAASASVSVG